MLETVTRPAPLADAWGTPPPRPALAPPRAKRRGLWRFFLLLVLLPTALFGAWQVWGAADQYAVEIRFAVRPADPARAALPSGMLAGLAAGSTDAYAVVQHLQSREAIRAVSRHADVLGILGREEADPLSRLPPGAPLEQALRIWRAQVHPYFDRSSGIVSVEVRAWSAADALALAQAVERTAEELVNSMSARSRAEVMAAAEREVRQAEARFAAARAAVQTFREQQQVVDPRRNAQALSEHLVKLQSELIGMTAQLTSLRRVMSDGTTQVMQLRSQIAGTEQQIGAVQARLTAEPGDAAALSTTIGGFDALETEMIFAQKSYEAAMAGLDRARAEASRQQVYLAPVVRPVAPEYALYPTRLSNILTVLAGALLAWLVGLIALRALREHLA